jgi:hypothetical protein
MDKLTASEAVYGFCAWLTTRRKTTTMSDTDDAAPIVELIRKFCDTNGLEEPRGDWHKKLIHPKEKSVKRIFEIEWDDELGPMWLNKDSVLACLNSKLHCGPGLVNNIKDVTEEQWLYNTIKKKVLKRMPSAKI